MTRWSSIIDATKTFSKGAYETVKLGITKIGQEAPAVPKILAYTGAGTGAIYVGSTAIGYSGKKIGEALKDVGLSNKTAAELFDEETKALKTRLELAKKYGSQGSNPYLGTGFYEKIGGYEISDDNYLAAQRELAKTKNDSSQIKNTPLIETAKNGLIIMAIAGGLILAYKFLNKKVAK